MQAVEAREPVDVSVDPLRRGQARGVGEEMADEEPDLVLGHDAGPHRGPQAPQRRTRQSLGGPTLGQPAPGLCGVEVDVTTLLAHDPAQQLPEHRVVRLGCQAGVARLCRPFVDRPPGHVHGGQMFRHR